MKIASIILCILLLLNFIDGIAGNDFENITIESNEELDDLSNEINLMLSFSKPSVTQELNSNFHSISLDDLDNFNIPGEPLLPFKSLKILLPYGQDINDIRIKPNDEIPFKSSYNIEPGKIPFHSDLSETPFESPLNLSLLYGAKSEKKPDGIPEISKKNKDIFEDDLSEIYIKESVYESTLKYPGELFSKVSIQNFRGYRILVLRIYPVQFIPKSGMLFYYPEMELSITTKQITDTENHYTLMRNLPEDQEKVMKMVDNPVSAETYKIDRGTRSLVNSSLSYKYVIITDEYLNKSFQPLIDWKNTKGVSATSVTVENITSDPDYNGNDTQEEIRNFILDAYSSWGTEYVLLGGDDEIIPHRGVYGVVNKDTSYEFEELDIPCDLYYGALDGNWDNDNDGIYGEGDSADGGNGTSGEEADFFAEVYIGRAPVYFMFETQNFINKIISYEQTPLSSPYLNNNLMLSAKLNEFTDGGVASDGLIEYLPSTYSSVKLYERDETASSTSTTIELNSGHHLVNNIGHADPSAIGLACEDYHDTYDTSEVDSLTNTEYFLLYSIGCYSNSFDNRWSNGSYGDDAVGEYFIHTEHGAFAYIGNTRYGLYSSGHPGEGPSDQFNTEFYDGLFNEKIINIGRTLQDSKEDLYGSVDAFGSMRWIYFTLTLSGDPETPYLNIDNPPKDLEVVSIDTHSENEIYSTGNTYLNSTIRNNGINTENNFNVSLEIREVITPRFNRTLFYDDMENYSHPDRGGKKLVEYNRIAGQWENGVPSNTYGPTSAHSGANCWGTNINGNYRDYGSTIFSGVLEDQGLFVDVYGRNDFLDIPAQEGDNIYINISWTSGADLDLYLYKPEDVFYHQTTGFNYIAYGVSGSFLYEVINYTVQTGDGNGIFQVRVDLYSGGDTSYDIEEITVDEHTYYDFDYPNSLKRVDNEGSNYEYPEVTYHHIYIPYYPYAKYYVEYWFKDDVDLKLYDPDGDEVLSNSLDNDGYWWGSYYADESGLWTIRMFGEGADFSLDNYTIRIQHPNLWFTLEMPSIDLSDPWIESCYLSFWNWYDIEEDYDYGYVFVSPNGGNWWYYLKSYTGNNSLNGWTQEWFDLKYFLGYSDVIVMFGFTSDQFVNKPGWYIDDIQVNATIAPTEMTVFGPVNQTVTDDLISGETKSLSWDCILKEEGNYRIIVKTHLPLDNNVTNDQKNVQIQTNFPPRSPVINSDTHPNQNNWYIDNEPYLRWTTESKFTDYIPLEMDEAIISSNPDMNFDIYNSSYVGHDVYWNITGRTYLKFNLTNVFSQISITKASLYVYLRSEFHDHDESIGVYFCPDDTWSNKTITWNNAPSAAEMPSSTNDGPFNEYSWYRWNVTSDLISEYNGDKILTEVLRDILETSDTFKYFLESESNPVLQPFIKYSYITTNTSKLNGYSFALDHTPTTIPDSIVNSSDNFTSYSNLSNGTWYFHVKAKDDIGNWSDAGHFKININSTFIWLEEGWNLISIPYIQEEQDLIKVLENIDGDYDAVQWYNNTDQNNSWKDYNVGKLFGNDLFKINESMGIWLHIIKPGGTFFIFNGTQPAQNQSITLYPGWNHVGFPSLSNRNRTEGLNNIVYGVDIEIIQWYDASTKSWHNVDSEEYLVPGRGYWIYSRFEKIWEIPI